ncbi:Putative tyrosine-protein kinase in cps region [Planctomycetes bacterium MalM25]|nr:Putative tyrosine-protein kinase in cps region [Planctomycetes bacterium MalM25]
MGTAIEEYSNRQDALAEPALGGGGDAFESLVRLVRIVRYRHQAVLWIVAGCLALGLTYYAMAPRYYRSEARLQVIDQSGEDLASISEQSGTDSLMATQREVVRSSEVIRRAIERLSPEHRVDLADTPPRKWISSINSRLSASTVRKTNIIRLGYESLDPETAAAVVRAVLDSYLDFVSESHRGAAADFLDKLIVQREKFETELANKQVQLLQIRERIGHLALPDRENVVDPIVARAIHLNESLLEAQRERIEIEASQATIQSAIDNGSDLSRHLALVEESLGEQAVLAAMGMGPNDLEVLAVQQSRLLDLRMELQKVAPFYGPAHPQVATLQQQVAGVEQYLASYRSDTTGRPGGLADAELGPMLMGMLDQAWRQAVQREQQITESFAAARAEASKQSGDLVRVEMLQREINRIEEHNKLSYEKMQSIDLQQVSAPIQTTIVEEPLPSERPASPQLRMVLAASLLGGLVLGVGVVYTQDLLDDRFGSPEEMAHQLGCRVLSVVRELQPLASHGLQAVQMFAKPQATESEAFRTLRTAITLGAEVSDRLVISSSEPSDGKTTISSNLAVSYAQTGKRTLLIDCDLRKPGLTALMDLKRMPGVTDILTAGGDIAAIAERCVRRTDLETLDVIPAGPRRPDPAELLLGPNLAELLAWADSRYDQVLLDCPPILAVSDAQIAARLVDGVVLVVTPEKNHRRLVSRACDSFLTSGTPLLGVVANRITEQAGKGYGYGYGYGYGHDDTAEALEEKPLAA